MADVYADLKNWSATASSNLPAGTTTIGTGLDDNLRQIQATVVQDLSNVGADIASASSCDLGAVPGLFHTITGTTGITSFGTVRAGIWKVLTFSGAVTITYNATSMITPDSVDLTTVAKDSFLAESLGSGNWKVHPLKHSNLLAANLSGTPDLPDGTTGTTQSAGDNSTKLATTAYVDTNKLINGTVTATTSGTSVDYTSIPSWVKRITIMFDGVSTNGTSPIILRLGDSGGIESTGYKCSVVYLQSAAQGGENDTTAFRLIESVAMGASSIINGSITLNLLNATDHTWVVSGVLGHSDVAYVNMIGGSKATSAALDRISVTTNNGTDAFDAGQINISYE